eukprot:6201410-Pleurochrysis_carterae.AAC.5
MGAQPPGPFGSKASNPSPSGMSFKACMRDIPGIKKQISHLCAMPQVGLARSSALRQDPLPAGFYSRDDRSPLVVRKPRVFKTHTLSMAQQSLSASLCRALDEVGTAQLSDG